MTVEKRDGWNQPGTVACAEYRADKAEARIAELEATIRSSRALADHGAHGECGPVEACEEIHKLLSAALRLRKEDLTPELQREVALLEGGGVIVRTYYANPEQPGIATVCTFTNGGPLRKIELVWSPEEAAKLKADTEAPEEAKAK
jgi:hypothetical protein